MADIGYRCTACAKIFWYSDYETYREQKAHIDILDHIRNNCASFADYRTVERF